MDNSRSKLKAAELIMIFLPIVGQDAYTGIKTAKECAKASAKIAQEAEDSIECGEINGAGWDWNEVITYIDTF